MFLLPIFKTVLFYYCMKFLFQLNLFTWFQHQLLKPTKKNDETSNNSIDEKSNIQLYQAIFYVFLSILFIDVIFGLLLRFYTMSPLFVSIKLLIVSFIMFKLKLNPDRSSSFKLPILLSIYFIIHLFFN